MFKYTEAYSGSNNVEFLEEDVVAVRIPLNPVFSIGEEKNASEKVVEKVVEKLTDNQFKKNNTLTK